METILCLLQMAILEVPMSSLSFDHNCTTSEEHTCEAQVASRRQQRQCNQMSNQNGERTPVSTVEILTTSSVIQALAYRAN